MRVQVVNRYVKAAQSVLAKETGGQVDRGGLILEGNPYTTDDVTAVVGISGSLAGSVYVSMSEETAVNVIGTILGQPTSAVDDLCQSGIAEMANVIAGTAGIELAEDGLPTNVNPPLVLIGRGARLSSVELQRVVVPLQTVLGLVKLHVALRES